MNSATTTTTKTEAAQAEQKPLTDRELCRQMIERAAAKNGGKLGGKGNYDARKFRRL
jgi:hypothetical protein